MKHLKSVAFLVLLAGCTAGTKVDPGVAARFQEGATSCAEIVSTLGKPWRTVTADGHVTLLHYDYAVGSPTPESMIPGVGMFVAGTNIHSTQHDFTCSPDGTMLRHTVRELDQYRAEGIANRK